MENCYNEPTMVRLDRKADSRGNLSFMEEGVPLPFAMKRVYWVNDVPGGRGRYGRALRSQWEVVVALAGSFRLNTVTATGEKCFMLSSPDVAVILPPMTWRTMTDFATNTAVLVIASADFDENDYIRDRKTFNTIMYGRE
ncbi:MAG: WxcM-like domain-containing protein [Bacteroides sp.]|nr:WxcM-like domain-containing protein [Bacteroides sp.]